MDERTVFWKILCKIFLPIKNKIQRKTKEISFDKISDKIISHGMESQYRSKKLWMVELIFMMQPPFDYKK